MESVQQIKTSCCSVLASCENALMEIREQFSVDKNDQGELTTIGIVSHDPGLRKPVTSDNHRNYLI